MSYYNYFLSLVIILSGLTDILRLFNIGPITALGVLTIFLAVATWILVFGCRKIPKAIFTASCLVLFTLQGLVNWVWYLPQSDLSLIASAIQNLSVLIAFVGFIVLSTIQSYRSFDSPEYMSKALTRATQFSVGLYSLSILIGGTGTSIIMGARSFALFAIIGVAWFLASWRYRLPGGAMWTFFTVLAIAFSFSRSALLIALILFPLSQISFTSLKSWLRIGLTISLIVVVSYLAFIYVEPMRDRFTQIGDNATVGGVKINTSGRNQAWPIVYNSALESPWIGKGPGSVATILVQRVGSAFSHPHNDYLRIFHDFGLIGLTLWFLGYLGLIIKTFQNWQWADRNDRENAHIHLAAFLSLVAIAIAMISDNVVVYIFSMAPLGILTGASLGSASVRKKLIKSHHKLAIESQTLEQLAIER